MKPHIIIEGEPDDLKAIAETVSDGGAAEALEPADFEEKNKFLDFNYSKCFPAWGYNPERDGEDRVITAKVVNDEA